MLAAIVITAALVIALVISIILFANYEEDPEEDEEMFKPMVYGMEGKEVMEAQKLLKAAGSSITVNGKYTIGMLTAVKTFQKKHGLEVTGKIDAKTMNKLKTYAKPVKPARKTAEKKPVKKTAK